MFLSRNIVLLAQGAENATSNWDIAFDRFQAVGPTVAASIVLVGALLTIRQKHTADRRSAWWARVEWSSEKTMAREANARAIGAAALAALASDDVRHPGDRDLLRAIVDSHLASLERRLSTAGTEPGEAAFVVGED